jgi:hypothetical protein
MPVGISRWICVDRKDCRQAVALIARNFVISVRNSLLAWIVSSPLFVLCLFPSGSFAGPPFLTDDPVPVDRGHWEVNNYVAGSMAKAASVGVAPGVDANYGAATDLQLHLLVPAAVAQINGMSAQWGLGDIESGAKYRFLPAEERDWWPQVAFYPFLDFPTGNANRGLGTGAAHAFFPIWLQKDFGNWSTYGGGGYWLNPGEGNKNFWYAGWVVQYQLTKALSLGGEVFHQTSSSIAVPGIVTLGSKDTTGLNFGGVYDINDTCHFLFSIGRALENVPASSLFSFYAAIRFTF